MLVLREVAGAVNASLHLPQVLQRILEALRGAFGFNHSMVLLPVDGEALEVRASIGYPETGVGARVGSGEGPIGVAARRRKLLRMGGMRSQLRYVQQVNNGGARVAMPGLPDVASVVVVPMVVGDELVGVLAIESPEILAFGEEDERLVTTVANLAAAAIRNARLYHDLLETNRSGERFVPHEFVRFLDKQSLKDLGRGQAVSRDMTLMFSDLRSFTSLAEHLDPGATFDLLNRYFAMMVPPIQTHRGFVDKFIGDAIMALFDEGTADGALSAALEEQDALRRLNAAQPDQPPLAMGIGLHRGPVTLGVVGSDERLSCTVYGDSVNLASRVEGLTRLYGAQVLVTGPTVAALEAPERFELRRVDIVRVRGKQEAVELYEPLRGLADAERASRAPAAALESARTPYAVGDFAGAVASFGALVESYPGDAVAQVLLARSRALAAAPPAAWDGVYRLDRK